MENDRLNLLNRILRDRYKASNIDEYFLREKEVLTELVKLIEKEDINKSLKKLLLKELCSILNDAISKLKKPASW